jgi:hypothetical protein
MLIHINVSIAAPAGRFPAAGSLGRTGCAHNKKPE